MSLCSLLLLLSLEVGFQREQRVVIFFFYPTCTPSLILSRTDRVLAAAEIIPSICVPHASASCAGALSPLSFPWCQDIPSSRPADGGCFHWLLGLWVFVFPREVRCKEEDNRMLGFFFLTAVEETVSPLARRAAPGWQQHLQH